MSFWHGLHGMLQRPKERDNEVGLVVLNAILNGGKWKAASRRLLCDKRNVAAVTVSDPRPTDAQMLDGVCTKITADNAGNVLGCECVALAGFEPSRESRVQVLKDVARAIGGRNECRDEFGNAFEITFDGGTLFGCEFGNGVVEVLLVGNGTFLEGDFAGRSLNRDRLLVVCHSEDSCD